MKSNSGFTMLELLVVVAIASALVGMALPSYIAFLDREKVNGLISEFASSLNVSRSAAIKSGIPTVICASSNGTSCGNNWSLGWLAFEDDDRNNAYSGGERIVLRTENNPDLAQLAVSSLGGGNLNWVRFNYRGAPNSALSINATSGDYDQELQVTPFGKARLND